MNFISPTLLTKQHDRTRHTDAVDLLNPSLLVDLLYRLQLRKSLAESVNGIKLLLERMGGPKEGRGEREQRHTDSCAVSATLESPLPVEAQLLW